jgi:ABC-type transporter Mla MlaB component
MVVPMATIALLLKLTEETASPLLREAGQKLDGPEAEVVVDFSSLLRITAGELNLVEEFVGKSDAKGVKVVLRGVNVDIYKVLTLTNLASRFSFVN